MDFAFYLDLVMIVLLVATIIYAIILNRKLAAFRRSREDMQNFLTAFNAANERAETSITALKEMAEQSGERLREDIEKAGALTEDLSFMVDRGESIANRLEKAARDVNSVRRNAGGSEGVQSASANSDTVKTPGGAAAGLGRMMVPQDRNDVIDDRDHVGVETRAEELAARMVGEIERGSNGPVDDGYDREEPARGGMQGSRADVSDPYDKDEDAGRSEAERELLAALRSVR